MAHSFHQTADLTCPRCGKPFRAELWLIVDAAERPDLLEKAKQGTLHQVVCPQCGLIDQADAPLLLFLPGEDPPLLFSPAQSTTAEQDAEHAVALIKRLRASLGPAWRDEWLQRGLPAVPRPLLPLALSEGLEAALRQMAEQAAAELERVRQENPEAYRQLESAARQWAESAPLLETLQKFIQADTWAESQRIVEEHRELLEEPTDTLLDQLIQAARVQGDQNAVRLLEEHRALLRRCREVGIPRAFAEKMLPPEALAAAEAAGLAPEQALEMARQAAQFPPELHEALEELARRGVEIRSFEDLRRALEENPDVREKLERAVWNMQGRQEVLLEFRQDIQRAQEFLQTYLQTGSLEALNQAAGAWQRILGHPAFGAVPERFRLAVLNEAGGVFLRRYWRTGATQDLDFALQGWQQAVAATPPDSPDRPARLNNLGNGLRDRYGRTGRLEDLEEARNSYRQACSLAEVRSQNVLLTASRTWGGWAFKRQAWEEAAEAYRFSFRAIERLFRAQFSRAGKESWIREIQGLPARAAYALLQIGQLEQALEALEAGRARLLGEALERSRRDLENLAAQGRGDLLKRYREAAARYEALSRLTASAEHSETAISRPADWLQQIEAAQAELDEVIEQIRQVPGYETFLRTLAVEQIQSLAQDAPLVYLAATEYGGFALIVQASGVESLELPKLTEEALREQVVGPKDDPAIGGYLGAYWRWRNNSRDETARQAWFAALEAMLAWLGEAVMTPLVARLEALGVPPGSVVRLIPGSWLSLLPLHAAVCGTTRSSGPAYALDHYTFAYLPSAQALYHARQAAERPSESLLLVDNPDGTLTFSEQEARGVQDVFAQDATTTLKGARATKERVSKAMKEAGVLHFSTHGRAGWTESERAGVLLANGEWLTLPEIFELRLQKTRLAVLSACETGVPALENPDEVEALPSGLMQAGVPGVVGSLWAVNDLSTALLMTWFYHFWRQEGMPLPQALRRAQRYLRDAFQSDTVRAELEALAAEQARDFLNLVTVCDFAHPYYWAGFTFTGI